MKWLEVKEEINRINEKRNQRDEILNRKIKQSNRWKELSNRILQQSDRNTLVLERWIYLLKVTFDQQILNRWIEKQLKIEEIDRLCYENACQLMKNVKHSQCEKEDLKNIAK